MDFCNNNPFDILLHNGRGPNGFADANGIRVTALSETCGVGEMELTPRHLNPNGTVHGGALYSLADTVAGSEAIACAMAKSGQSVEEISCTTVTGTFHYLRAARGSKLICTATCRKIGRTLSVIDVSITDDRGEETCSGTFTFCIIDRKRYMHQA